MDRLVVAIFAIVVFFVFTCFYVIGFKRGARTAKRKYHQLAFNEGFMRGALDNNYHHACRDIAVQIAKINVKDPLFEYVKVYLKSVVGFVRAVINSSRKIA